MEYLILVRVEEIMLLEIEAGDKDVKTMMYGVKVMGVVVESTIVASGGDDDTLINPDAKFSWIYRNLKENRND